MPVKVLLGQVHFIVKGCPIFLRGMGESVSRQVCKYCSLHH